LHPYCLIVTKEWNIKNLLDTKFIEIEKDLIEYFNDAVNRNDGNTPIFQAKEFAKKHGFTIEQAKEFVSELQMSKLREKIGVTS
jgi:hypothetical protein